MTRWFLVILWTEAAAVRRRSRLELRCAACLGGVVAPVVGLTPDLQGELAWNGARCSRCAARMSDPRLQLTIERIP